MSRDELTVRLAGTGGDGVISAGDLLAQACARAGLEVFTFRTVPAEIVGGRTMYQLRVSNKPLYSQGDRVDVLVAFNLEEYQDHRESVAGDGIVIYDPGAHEGPLLGEPGDWPLPLETIAVETVGTKRGKNVVALGAMASLLPVRPEELKELILEKWGRSEEARDMNSRAFEAGFDYAREHFDIEIEYMVTPEDVETKLVLTGNQAISVGAIGAGLKAFFGYPITPASDILEQLAKELPAFGGSVIQMEDEIASIGGVIGASYAGKKAMTSTSGPGLSLMCELLGLAFMAEIPVVVVDVQRGGPSTGLPTKTEQSDLNLAVFGSHGDAPRIVVAPACVADCLFTTVDAFNLAEKYQMPVILLTDQALAQRQQTIPRPDISSIPIINRLTAEAQDTELGIFPRYQPTESGISPMPIPGTQGACYIAEGLEHNPNGTPNVGPKAHTEQSEKRMRKFQAVCRERGFLRVWGNPRASFGVVCWGSTEGASHEAAEMAKSEMDLDVAVVTVRLLWPLPEELDEVVARLEVVLVPEANLAGQFAQLLSAHYRRDIMQLNQYNGLPFTPQTILEKIKEVAAAHGLLKARVVAAEKAEAVGVK